MSEWQPIETAPRDGTEILGFRPDQGVFIFRWAETSDFDSTDPGEEWSEDWWHDLWGWMEGDLQPTHWMPLPPPPSPSTQENENE